MFFLINFSNFIIVGSTYLYASDYPLSLPQKQQQQQQQGLKTQTHLEPQVSSFSPFFFLALLTFFYLQLDYMGMKYDGDDKHTPSPIPKFGWTGGLMTHLHLELLFRYVFFFFLFLLFY